MPPLPNFHAWRDLFPELQILLDNFGEIQREALEAVETGWKDWPEEHYSDGGAQDWKVFPFAHTFPADDPARTKFIESTCAACPNTVIKNSNEISKRKEARVTATAGAGAGPK